MKNNKIKFITLLFIAVTLITACKKGDKGPKGDTGATGNANVSSKTVTLSSSDWNGGVAVIVDSRITQDIIDKGTIMVYSVNGTSNAALPVTVYLGSNGLSLTTRYIYSLQTVKIIAERSDYVSINHVDETYKIVVIAGH